MSDTFNMHLTPEIMKSIVKQILDDARQHELETSDFASDVILNQMRLVVEWELAQRSNLPSYIDEVRAKIREQAKKLNERQNARKKYETIQQHLIAFAGEENGLAMAVERYRSVFDAISNELLEEDSKRYGENAKKMDGEKN